MSFYEGHVGPNGEDCGWNLFDGRGCVVSAARDNAGGGDIVPLRKPEHRKLLPWKHGLHKWLKGTAYTKTVLEIAGCRVVFAQVHLVWKERRLRRAQMEQLIRDLADEPQVVIAGDFNVGTTTTEGFDAYLKDRSKVSRSAKSGECGLFRAAGYALGNDDSFPTAPAGFNGAFGTDDSRLLSGIPVLPGTGCCWGAISSERENLRRSYAFLL